MKQLIVFLALLMASQAYAQDAVVVPVGSGDAPAAVGNNQGNPIYIINKNRVSGSQEATQGTTTSARVAAIQEQPVSVVQEAPLKAGAAESMRKNRMDSEAQTEDGIVQALERARMQDEIKRRDRFNSAIAPVEKDTTIVNQSGVGNTATVVTAQQQQAIAAPVTAPIVAQPVQAIQVAPVAVPPIAERVERVEPAQPIQKIHVVEEQEEVISDYHPDRRDDGRDVHSEVRANLEEPRKKDENRESYYVSALASFGQYNNVVNVDKSLGYGVQVGTVLENRIVVEGSFMYGNYQLADMYLGACGYGACSPLTTQMRQYNMDLALKYQLLSGRFRPLIGAVLGYTRRNYQIAGQEFRTSDAADVGALVGADLALTESFAIGVDFRYMTNLGYRQNVDAGEIVYQQANDPERLDYYTLNLLAKFMF